MPALARAQPAVVWPTSPAIDPAPAEAALRDAGVDVIAFAEIAGELRAGADRARDGDLAASRDVQNALAAARDAYLEQRWDDMIAACTVGSDALEVLARPASATALWELELQRGIAHLLRNRDGDAANAAAHFGLAIAIDRDRRPERSLYGPDITAAYADAVAALASAAPRPVAISVDPFSARVTVDGQPKVAAGRSISLIPGLHIVRAEAPGYQPRALLADTRTAGTVTLTLAVADDRQAALGDAWIRGALAGDADHERRALLAIARAHGAARVVLVTADRARVIDATGAGPWVTGHSIADAATRAAAPPPAPPPQPPGSTPIYRRWWFWVAAAGVAGTAAALGYVATADHADRWRVFAGDP